MTLFFASHSGPIKLLKAFQNFMRNNIDGTTFIQPCVPFLIQISNLSLQGCANCYKSIKKLTEA